MLQLHVEPPLRSGAPDPPEIDGRRSLEQKGTQDHHEGPHAGEPFYMEISWRSIAKTKGCHFTSVPSLGNLTFSSLGWWCEPDVQEEADVVPVMRFVEDFGGPAGEKSRAEVPSVFRHLTM